MAASKDEFDDITSAENFVDLGKIRKAAHHGIPVEKRAEVWKYLLSVSKPDKSVENSLERRLSDEYLDFDRTDYLLLSTVKGEINRYVRAHSSKEISSAASSGKFERAIITYMNLCGAMEADPGMVHLIGPFVHVMTKESDIFYCFQGLMQRLDRYFSDHEVKAMVARFTMLFRTFYPELVTHFEDEELDIGEWAPGWIKYLLARELPLDCILRLWDTYFAADHFDLHVYVCIAILGNCCEALTELEHPEIKLYLRQLPFLDMDVIITEAENLLHEVEAMGLLASHSGRES